MLKYQFLWDVAIFRGMDLVEEHLDLGSFEQPYTPICLHALHLRIQMSRKTSKSIIRQNHKNLIVCSFEHLEPRRGEGGGYRLGGDINWEKKRKNRRQSHKTLDKDPTEAH